MTNGILSIRHDHSTPTENNRFFMDTSKVMPVSFPHHEEGGSNSVSNRTMNQSESSVKMH